MRRDTLKIALCLLLALPAAAPAQNANRKSAPPKNGKGVSGRAVKVKPPAKAAPAPAETPVTVTVRTKSEVPGTSFTLGEIAAISGNDKDLIAQLAAIRVGTSPLPGLSRLLYPGDITVCLRANHLEIKRVQVTAPPQIEVARAWHDVAADDITKAALDAVQDVLKDFPEATVEADHPPTNLAVPQGKLQMVAGAYRGRPEQGSLTVPISLTVDGKPFQTVQVTLRVHRKARVLIANRQLEPHDILTADDVSLARIDLPLGFTEPVTTVKEAIGKRVKRRILAESPIPANALEIPPAILTNDRITIEYIFGTIRITAPGKARQPGAIGETIGVYALDTKKDLDAVVVDSHTVRIVEEAESE